MSVTQIILLIIFVGSALYFIFGRKTIASPQIEIDAKRFAKLLVSEIKLYEEYKVERGMKNNNLYESLRLEIEEARKKYKQKFSDADFEGYFDDTLIEVLADGDKKKLGIVSSSLIK